jgi:hypothetical protein
MSISSNKRNRDKDGKGASGGEAGTNYIIGTADRGGRTSDTKEEEVTAATTSTAPNRTTSNQERITPQKER